MVKIGAGINNYRLPPDSEPHRQCIGMPMCGDCKITNWAMIESEYKGNR